MAANNVSSGVSCVPPPCGRTLGCGISGFAISHSPSGTIQLHVPRPMYGSTSASPRRTRSYTHISDPSVLADYQSVLQPGAVIAGPLAETLRAGQLDQDALDWLRTNFYKTELELGRCLRLPQEGPCECDLYLSCAKFVTTLQYAPRLRERLCTEREIDRGRRGPRLGTRDRTAPADCRPHLRTSRRPR